MCEQDLNVKSSSLGDLAGHSSSTAALGSMTYSFFFFFAT